MNHYSDFFCQAFLQRTKVGSCGLFLFNAAISSLLRSVEDLDISGGIGIAYVQPELVEFVRRSITI